jgi:hypothetical protein
MQHYRQLERSTRILKLKNRQAARFESQLAGKKNADAVCRLDTRECHAVIMIVRDI